MNIEIEDPVRADIQALLQEHLRDMRAISPPESVHALDVDALRTPQITFLAARENGGLIGCGALKALDSTSGEIKSMRTANGHLRKGVAAAILVRILNIAHQRSYQQLKLETGRTAAFEPAQRLYERFGFATCAPFADYTDDPFSLYMSAEVASARAICGLATVNRS